MGWHGAGTAEWSYLASPSEIKRLVFQEWRRERPMTTLLSSPREFCALWDQESQSLLPSPCSAAASGPKAGLFPCLLPLRDCSCQAKHLVALRRAAGDGIRSQEL